MIVRDLIKRFGKSTRGNVAVISAFLFVVLLGAAGGGVDLSLLVSKRSAAQDASDAAALFAASANTADIPTLQKQTTDAFNANVKGTNAGEATVKSFDYDPKTQTITVKAGGSYTPLFAQLFGTGQVQYGVTSTTRRAVDGTVEVALVLDNTWSMSTSLDGVQSKINVLKDAANTLTDTLMTPTNANYVKIGIVPYATYVNVGMGNRYQSWLTVPADYSTSTTVTTPEQAAVPAQCAPSNTQYQCTGGQKGTCSNTTYSDGVPTTTTYSCWTVAQTCGNVTVPTYQKCTAAVPYQAAKTTTTVTYNKWYGCVNNLLTGTWISDPDPVKPYPGRMDDTSVGASCLSPILPLSSDSSVVKTSISNLTVRNSTYTSETYIPSGLQWGINVLSPTAQFTEGAPYDAKNKLPRKAIVLMTDGANTQYLQTDGTITLIKPTASVAQVAKTYAEEDNLCAYAKAKDRNIEVYTIGFGVTDAVALAHLQSCATDANHYFDAKDSASLKAAFATIAGSLSKVRIAH